MSQPRVTDFFAQRKRGVSGPVKPGRTRRTAGSSTRSRSSKIQDELSSSIHQEFLRVIDEASEQSDRVCGAGDTGDKTPTSPRTPKRSSAEVDHGPALSSATADHSTAKKSRRAEGETRGKVAEKTTRRTARKKLLLPHDSPQAAAKILPVEVNLQHNESQTSTQTPGPGTQTPGPGTQTPGPSTQTPGPKAVSKVDISALKSRLQRIKKHAGDTKSNAPASPSSSSSFTAPITSSSSSPTSSSSSFTAPTSSSTASPAPITSSPISSSDSRTLKMTVVQVRELAARAQRRKEEREVKEREEKEVKERGEVKESQQSETPTQDSVAPPAYQRYHALSQAAPPGLALPYAYRLLSEMFRSMDTVVAMLFNRSETPTFSKVKQGVQDMMRRQFEESHVGQIKTVFPEAYTFRQERNIPTFNQHIKKSSYQLTVEPQIPSDQNESRPVLSASRLLERRHVFHHNLLSIVKQHHKEFLSSLAPPVSVPEDRLTRWHPRFNVDLVPAVAPSPLPRPPHSDRLTTAQEVLDKARALITPKMEKALVSLVQTTEVKAAESKDPTSPSNPQPACPLPSALPSALKGVSQSLLERVRAKEAQRLQAAMTRDPQQEERLLMMSRLPDLARILRNVFVAEKKAALIMEVACNRTAASYRSALSTGDMEKHIRLLAEVASDWLSIHPIRKDFYLKLNKNMELKSVVERVSSRLKEEQGV